MRKELPLRLEQSRITTGRFGSDSTWGTYGCFHVIGPNGVGLRVIASGGDDNDPLSKGWEHVSVSLPNRCPNWPEMSFVKDLFWDETETVVQFHPPKSQYVDQHPYCLHLWRSKHDQFPLPPSVLVGVKDPANPTAEEAEAVARWRR